MAALMNVVSIHEDIAAPVLQPDAGLKAVEIPNDGITLIYVLNPNGVDIFIRIQQFGLCSLGDIHGKPDSTWRIAATSFRQVPTHPKTLFNNALGRMVFDLTEADETTLLTNTTGIEIVGQRLF